MRSFLMWLAGGRRAFHDLSAGETAAPDLSGECGAPPISGGTQISRRKDSAHGGGGLEQKKSPHEPYPKVVLQTI